MNNTEPVWIEENLFIVSNEDGNLTADVDRPRAIKRMADDYGGSILRVMRLTVKVPRPRDYLASIVLPEDGGETMHVAIEG